MKRICNLAFVGGLLSLYLAMPSLQFGASTQTPGQVRITELKAFLYADGGFLQSLTPASSGYTSNFNANGYGSFGWQFNTPANTTLTNARFVVFLDADLDRDTTTFFNEHGTLSGLNLPPGATPHDIKASGWEIDEPGFLFGDLAQHLSIGVLDQINSVPASAPDDVALALSFQLGTLPPNFPVKSFFFISQTDIGSLSQTDVTSNAKLWFNGFINADNPPQITAATIMRQQGSPATIATIANVTDDLTPTGNLVVTVSGPAPGIYITGILNSNGTITASVSAACNAALGSRSIGLTVTDGNGGSATANLIVNVTANQPPTLGNYSATLLDEGGGTTIPPSPTPTDNGSISGLAVTVAPGTFTGAAVINPLNGMVTISNAGPAGAYTLTVTATDNCGVTATRTFALVVNHVTADNRVTSTISDPINCVAPGSVLNVQAAIISGSGGAQRFEFVAPMPPQLVALADTCTTSGGSCTVTTSEIRITGTLSPNQTINVSYRVQVRDNAAGASFCIASTGRFDMNNDGVFDTTATTQACGAANCPAIGPGLPFPDTAEVSDQKSGSVLFYNLYSSSAASPNTQNTRLGVTNIHPALPVAVHLFFVDGASCSVADAFVCLTPNQTTSFLASDLDPGTTGYLIAIAVDRTTGCPVNFNFLIGSAYVKLASGHTANLGAEAFAAVAGGLPACDDASSTAILNFDGVSYNRAPRVLAIDSISSRADGNDTLLVINRIGGNLATGADTLNPISGILYDDAEKAFSFTFSPGICQFRSSLSNNFPRTTPRLEQLIPAGRSGWMKLSQASDSGLLGAVINFNPNAGASASAFNQGHNLHKLTLTTAASLTIPVFPPSC